MINLPASAETVQEIFKRKHLGLGIHLNVTFGQPVSEVSEVSSLLHGGKFKKFKEQTTVLPKAGELAKEYQNQIRLFQKIFKRKPTHLDTHHQVHDLSFFYEVLREVALENKLPIRRSLLMRQATTDKNVSTTDYFFGNLTVEGYWRLEALKTVLKNLPDGVSEIMCHPGIVDRDLKSVSSFTSGRKAEYDLFSSPSFRNLISLQGISLSHFGNVL